MMIKQSEYNNKKVTAISFIDLNLLNQFYNKKGEYNCLASDLRWKQINRQLTQLRTENKSLSNQIQFKTLQGARCNDFMIELSKNLNELSKSIPDDKVSCLKLIAKCTGQLKQHLNNGIWEEFKLRFADIHTDFYDKLIRQYPALSESDLRLCAFIKLKMSTKEIADVINHPVNSVKVSRNRLRSKLQIEDSSESLLYFLAKY